MLEVRLLGQFAIWLEDALVEMPSRPAQTLFAYLVLNAGVAQRRERLAGLFWPDSSEEKARRNLRQALWQVRRALGAASATFLLVDELTLSFDPQSAYWLDAAVISQTQDEGASVEALLACVDAYQGELLPGFYDDWVVLERERLQAQYEQKMQRLLERLGEASRWQDVLPLAERWIALGHTPEPAYRALMLAHANQGDSASAAEAYRRCVEALKRDLDVTPSAQTRSLYEQLRRGKLGSRTPPQPSQTEVLSPRHNLPVQFTSFIGREKELAEIQRLLIPSLSAAQAEGVRLLTLTGPGGTGKTRLALQAATHLLDRFPDGVWWIELALLSDHALVPQTLAAVLGVREEPSYPLTRTLIEYLRPKTLLLLLDNCEHLIEPCAQFVAGVLRACPQVKLLTTSRETLGMTGETVLRVPSLSLPDAHTQLPLAELLQCEAIRLFVERATTVQLAFRLTEANAAAIIQICRQLDGVPLAIELAAARIRTMPPEQIAARLDDRFRLLTGGSRTALPRQQTLRALIDWSWDLLTDAERACLRRLAVFVDGWTLEAAEAVCTGGGIAPEDVLELLTHLVEKSLVLVEEAENAARYYLLQTIRQYALDKLLVAEESAGVRDCHLTFFAQLAATAEPQLRAADQLLWLARLDLEHDNLRAALHWAVSSGALETGLALTGNLARFWYLRGYWKEGRDWLQLLLAQPAPEPVLPDAFVRARIKALCGAGWLANDEGAEVALYTESLALARQIDDKWAEAFSLRGLASMTADWAIAEEAEPRLQASLALFRALADAWGMALALFNLGWLALWRDHQAEAETLWSESLAQFRSCGDRWGIAVASGALGYIARLRGDYAPATELTNAGLTHFRELGDKAGIALSLGRLGNLAFRRGDYAEASAFLQESLAIDREHGDQEGILNSLQLQGLVACAQGDFLRATALLEESVALARERGIPGELADGLAYLAFTKYYLTESTAAETLFQESLALYQQSQDKQGIAYALQGLGLVALEQGDFAVATERLHESTALWQARGDPHYIAASLAILGRLAQMQGDHPRACTHFRESLTLYKQMADKQGVAETLEWLAGSLDQTALAVRLFAAAHRLRQQISTPVPPVEQANYARWVNSVRSQLGESAFTAAWANGVTLTLEQAIAAALAEIAG